MGALYRSAAARVRDFFLLVVEALARAGDVADAADSLDAIDLTSTTRHHPAPVPGRSDAPIIGIPVSPATLTAASTRDPWVKRYKLVDRDGRDVGVEGDATKVALFRTWSAANHRRRAGERIAPVRVRQSQLTPTLVKPSMLAVIALLVLVACADPTAPRSAAGAVPLDPPVGAVTLIGPGDDVIAPCAVFFTRDTLWIDGVPYLEDLQHCESPVYGAPHVTPIVPVPWPDSSATPKGPAGGMP